jgi:Fe-S oxidoreductase
VVGHLIDMTVLGQMDPASARRLHLGFWWLHAILVALLFVSIPVTRFLHVLTGPMNIAARPDRPMGALAGLQLGAVEKVGHAGVAALGEFTRQQLLSLDACMECGRCEEACPAWASGKPLSPKAVIVNLRNAMPEQLRTRNLEPGTRNSELLPRKLHGGVISADTLWACTMCQACVQECPVLIGHVDMISDMRRHLVGEGQISGPPSKAMTGLGRQSNPYGRSASERLAWAAGLNVHTVDANPDFEYLFWVGCAAAFDPRAQKVARATVQLLQEAKVNFAVLGTMERCTGDPARRLGDEFLFQELAQANVQTLNGRKVKKIVTPCPHCFNTLKNEYPQFGGSFQVEHHSQMLAGLVRDGRLQGSGKLTGGVTLHDPCYLARVNGEIAAPRAILKSATGSSVREMPRHGAKTFCCGAGGGRMWFDEPPAQRVSNIRAAEVVGTGARTLATACPFCLNMMTDAMAGTAGGQSTNVQDIAEILLAGRAAGSRENA